jgi:hypothetical protein
MFNLADANVQAGVFITILTFIILMGIFRYKGWFWPTFISGVLVSILTFLLVDQIVKEVMASLVPSNFPCPLGPLPLLALVTLLVLNYAYSSQIREEDRDKWEKLKNPEKG